MGSFTEVGFLLNPTIWREKIECFEFFSLNSFSWGQFWPRGQILRLHQCSESPLLPPVFQPPGGAGACPPGARSLFCVHTRVCPDSV